MRYRSNGGSINLEARENSVSLSSLELAVLTLVDVIVPLANEVA